MAYDPLSPTTRKFRKSLISVSTISIAIELFSFTITEIPIAGVKIQMAQELIPFLLFSAVLYLFFSFAVYAAEDLINSTTPSYIKNRINNLDKIRNLIDVEFKQGLEQVFRAHFGTNFNHPKVATSLKQIYECLWIVENQIELKARVSTYLKGLDEYQETSHEKLDDLSSTMTPPIIEQWNDRVLTHMEIEDKKPHSHSYYYWFNGYRMYFLELGFPVVLATLAITCYYQVLCPYFILDLLDRKMDN